MIPRSGGAPSVVVREPRSVKLSGDPLPPEAIVGGSPLPADGEITRWSGQSEVVTGVWSCTPGTFTDVEVDETFVVLSGRATIQPDGEEPVEVSTGDVCVLAGGTPTTWTVHETLLKVYVIREDLVG